MGQDQALLGLVSLANVACGFHAGDPVIMDRTVREAIRRGVDIGALAGLAARAGGRVTHISFHGALGNMAADAGLAALLVRAVSEFEPALIVLTSASRTIEDAAACGLRVARCFLADRTCDRDGSLVPRGQPGAVIPVPCTRIPADGDTKGALQLARSVQHAVAEAGGGPVAAVPPDPAIALAYRPKRDSSWRARSTNGHSASCPTFATTDPGKTPMPARLALATLAAPARADQWTDVQATKALKCGTFADVPLFAVPDPKTREMVGFGVDMGGAVAKHLGVAATIVPLLVEARVPEEQMGRVDITVAHLAYTTSRASQIAFSDPYYVAKEIVAVKASKVATTPEDLKSKRPSAAKGSTSELSINLNGAEPVTVQDTGSADMAVQQNKFQGIVANKMTISKLVNQSKEAGTLLKMITEPLLLEPVAIGLKKGEDALRAKVNEALYAMDKGSEINMLWNKRLGADTEYKLTRDEKVQPITAITFTPIP